MQKIKKIISLIWNEFIYGGHILSLGTTSVVFTSSILLNIKITWDCLMVVYLGSHLVFLYYQFQDIEEDYLTNPERCQHIKKYIKIIPFIVLFFVLISMGILIYFNKFYNLVFYIVALLLSLFYLNFFKGLTKKIIAFKNIFISFFETLSVIFLIIYYSVFSFLPLFLVIIFVYLRWFINTSSLDVKDVKTDQGKNLLTLPIILSKENLFNVLSIITVLAVIPIIFGVYFVILPKSSLMLLFTIPYTLFYLNKIKKRTDSSPYLYHAFINGEFILWSGFVLLGEFLL